MSLMENKEGKRGAFIYRIGGSVVLKKILLSSW